MNAEDPNAMTELDLAHLEVRVDELVHTVGQLKNENNNLRGRQKELMSERSELIKKTELARNRVEAMITRLKSMEENS